MPTLWSQNTARLVGFAMLTQACATAPAAPADEDAAVTDEMDAGRSQGPTPGDAQPDIESDGAAPQDAEAAREANPEEDVGAACLEDPILQHACLHVVHGPFAEVDAVHAGTAPDVSVPHTHFTVHLPVSGNGGTLAYRSTLTARYVIYLAGARLELRSATGDLLTPVYDDPVDGCAGLERMVVYELEQSVDYSLKLIPEPDLSSATLLFENIDSFTDKPWPERFEPCL